MRPVALITGASAGIGAALAQEFARHGHELVLVARREDKLAALADTIASTGHSRPHWFAIDLGRAGGTDQLSDLMQARGLEPAYVVNNAGFGLTGAAAALDRAEQLAMIDLNVRTLTDLSLRFLDRVARYRGGILNVGSIAGFMAGPNMAIYHATKAFVLSFSEALHWELKPRGVRVTALCPGPVATEFQERAGMSIEYFPKFMARSAERVARDGYDGLMQGRRVMIPGFPNRMATLLPRLVPRGLLVSMVGRNSGQRA